MTRQHCRIIAMQQRNFHIAFNRHLFMKKNTELSNRCRFFSFLFCWVITGHSSQSDNHALSVSREQFVALWADGAKLSLQSPELGWVREPWDGGKASAADTWWLWQESQSGTDVQADQAVHHQSPGGSFHTADQWPLISGCRQCSD